MKRKLKYDSNIDRDIILCRTYCTAAGKRTCRFLLEHSISYSTLWFHIPFFLRQKCQGHEEMCIISINRNDYCAARRLLDLLDPGTRRRITINRRSLGSAG